MLERTRPSSNDIASLERLEYSPYANEVFTRAFPLPLPTSFDTHRSSHALRNILDRIRTSSNKLDQLGSSTNIEEDSKVWSDYRSSTLQSPTHVLQPSSAPRDRRDFLEQLSNNSRTTLEHHPIGFRA